MVVVENEREAPLSPTREKRPAVVFAEKRGRAGSTARGARASSGAFAEPPRRGDREHGKNRNEPPGCLRPAPLRAGQPDGEHENREERSQRVHEVDRDEGGGREPRASGPRRAALVEHEETVEQKNEGHGEGESRESPAHVQMIYEGKREEGPRAAPAELARDEKEREGEQHRVERKERAVGRLDRGEDG